MQAEACDKCNGPPSLTKEDWATWGPVIKDYYLNRGWSLPKIRQEMHEKHNFHCKERQYKTQFRKNPEYASKRLRSEQYQAMAVVAKALEPQSVNFRACRGGRRVDVTLQQIHKELGRCRKRKTAGQTSKPHVMAPDEAHSILNTTGIQVVFGPGLESGQDAPALLPHFEAPASPDGSDTSASVATPIDSPSTLIDFAHAFSLPPSHNSSHSPYSVDQNDGVQLSIAGMSFSMNPQSLPEYPNPYEYLFVNSASDVKASPVLSISANPYDRGLPPPQAPDNEEKQRTVRWARPFYMGCFSAARYSLHDLNTLKAEAIQSLRTILMVNPENKYVFPCLNEVVTVLSTNEKWVQLEEFLRESDRVIDEGSPLATPFRYALAACRDDSNAKRIYGPRLLQTHKYMVPKCGLKHPNILVNSYYWAWHLMENEEYRKVIINLEDRLAAAEKLLDGQKLDGHNLMIVNCMVMLGRAYAMTNQHQSACNHYGQALERLYDHSYLQAYKLIILLRLAQSQAELGDMTSAELHMKQVVHGRIAIFGYSSPVTWSAIHDYYGLLIRVDQQHTAEAMFMYHTQGWERHQNRQWYDERGLQIPIELLDPPGPTNETWSAPMTMRSQGPPLQSRM